MYSDLEVSCNPSVSIWGPGHAITTTGSLYQPLKAHTQSVSKMLLHVAHQAVAQTNCVHFRSSFIVIITDVCEFHSRLLPDVEPGIHHATKQYLGAFHATRSPYHRYCRPGTTRAGRWAGIILLQYGRSCSTSQHQSETGRKTTKELCRPLRDRATQEAPYPGSIYVKHCQEYIRTMCVCVCVWWGSVLYIVTKSYYCNYWIIVLCVFLDGGVSVIV